MKKTTPAVIVENGTLKKQRQFFGKLGELPKIIEQNSIKSPALIIIGYVVKK